VELPEGTCGLLVSKSGLNVRDSVLSTGLIDAGYTGSIAVKLYNLGDKPVHLSKGAKVSQLVVLPVLCPDIVQADEIASGERGENGFGSTGA
jgi:dUTP pyrophosphatase